MSHSKWDTVKSNMENIAKAALAKAADNKAKMENINQAASMGAARKKMIETAAIAKVISSIFDKGISKSKDIDTSSKNIETVFTPYTPK